MIFLKHSFQSLGSPELDVHASGNTAHRGLNVASPHGPSPLGLPVYLEYSPEPSVSECCLEAVISQGNVCPRYQLILSRGWGSCGGAVCAKLWAGATPAAPQSELWRVWPEAQQSGCIQSAHRGLQKRAKSGCFVFVFVFLNRKSRNSLDAGH